MKTMYRAEIDGLRALAVLSVVGFHAGMPMLAGGFLGVDVFFVISGYLITTIITGELRSGTFNIWTFYERRARRILPALYLVILCCIPLALFWLFPPDLVDFFDSAIAATFLVANIFFWNSTGYFDTAAETKPLLHLWTLGVEAQFYISFPLLILFVARFKKNVTIGLIALLAAASLAGAEYASRFFPSFGFYALPTRAWEFLAGALCAYIGLSPNKLRDNALAGGGLILVIGSILAFDNTYAMPSFYTLPVIAGTCAIIMFGGRHTAACRLLSLPPLVGLGMISYSAYLWHHPLLAFARTHSLFKLDTVDIAALVAGTFILAYLTWRFVEVPLRKPSSWMMPSTLHLAAFVSAIAFIVTAYGITTRLESGFPSRLPGSVQALLDGSRDIGRFIKPCSNGLKAQDPRTHSECQLGKSGQRYEFLLLGDSFASALADGVSAAAARHGKSGLLFALHACPPIAGLGGWWEFTIPRCNDYQSYILDLATTKRPEVVILHAQWEALGSKYDVGTNDQSPTGRHDRFLSPMIETVRLLHEAGIDVYVVCCTPVTQGELDVPRSLATIEFYGRDDDIRISRSQLEELNKTALVTFKSSEFRKYATLIDIMDFFCRDGMCDLTKNGRPLLYDATHLSKFASERLTGILETPFRANP